MSRQLDRVEARQRLPIRRDPYWHRVAQGQYIGFRRMTRASIGTWLARANVGGRYAYKTLGEFAEVQEKDRFDAVNKAAAEWFRHIGRGGSTEKATVKAACDAYVAHLRKEKGEASAKDAEGAFRRLVDEDPIARADLSKLKPTHFSAWRERVIGKGSSSYFNRNLTPLRAAMNYALDQGAVSSDFAWSKALRPLKLDPREGRRMIYLDAAQRRKLIEKASAELRPMLTAWTLLPVRPGDVARLRVEHLDAKGRSLTIPNGKTDSRVIPLSDDALAHFKSCARGKLPGAWLIARADGSQWTRFAWRNEMWEAVKRAKLPRAVVAYSLRHSCITDLMASGLDPLTVARLSGTSIAMIDKHYGHLRAEHARKGLEVLALR